MLKKELMPSGGDPTWARVCDTCRCSASRVYCTTDAAYLCAACDARIHASAPGHYRVWVCEACESLPAAFVCKADSASLCVDCDAKIHSANPLASRHQRIPISACLYGATPTNNLGSTRMLGSVPIVGETDDDFDEDDEDEAASWLILNPSNNNNNNHNNTKEINTTINGSSIGGEVVDEYLDLVEFDLGGGDNRKLNDDHQHNHHEHHQCTVPIGVEQDIMHNQHSFHMSLDFDHIKTHQYSYNNFSMPHTMSMSSMDVGVVPESRTSENDLSTNNNTHDHHHQQQQPTIPTQLSPMDREARVQRYREKKKTRKFEKTIRYASRKAYAETRPRIKGRFAKRNTHDDIEANNVMSDTGYGVVPSF